MAFNFNSLSDLIDKWAESWTHNRRILKLRSISKMIWNSSLIAVSVLFIGCFFLFGIIAGYFAELVHDQPILSYKTLKHDIYNFSESSESYFAGGIPIGKMKSDLVRTSASLNQFSPNLIHALLATEDERFYQHNGVVPKAVIRATIQELAHEPHITGGSTITQQLVKNQLLTNEVSFQRKAKEILLAMRVEHFFTKNQILDAYLNIVPFGRNASGQNIAGAAAAAEGIFGVKPDKLNIPQAAYLAGLPKNPFVYSPFENHGGVKKDFSAGIGRAHTVLRRMYEAGYISHSDLEKYLKYDYRKHLAKAHSLIADDYPYVTDEVDSEAQTIMAKVEAKNEGYSGDKLYDDYTAYKKIIYEANHHVYGQMSAQAIAKSQGESYDTLSSHYQLFNDFLTSATQKLQIGGYKIYTTINKPIYDSMQQYTQNYSGYEPDKWKVVQDPKTGKNKTVRDPMQVGSVLIKNDTGAIISFVGGRGFGLSQINHATQTLRQNGSTMKPLLVYAPAMELGLIQPGSIVADLPYKRVLSSGVYQPEDYSGRFHGFETARKALYQSDNVPAVSIFTRLSRATNSAPDYLKKMGFTSLVGSDGHNISAALGGITRGVTVEENTNAYATFGNGGRFVDAYLIDKITDSSGHVIYRHKTQPTRVFSPQTNYLMLDMMRDVLKEGTARGVQSTLDFKADWAGKTGTSQNWRDSWFVATNPNVTLGVWTGYDNNGMLNRSTYAAETHQLWAGYANSAYQIEPELMSPSKRFEQPSGIVKRTFCGLTDGKVTNMCQAAGLTETDLFNQKYAPTQSVEALEPASGGYKIKPSFLQSHFPYLDLQAADSSLLGKVKK